MLALHNVVLRKQTHAAHGGTAMYDGFIDNARQTRSGGAHQTASAYEFFTPTSFLSGATDAGAHIPPKPERAEFDIVPPAYIHTRTILLSFDSSCTIAQPMYIYIQFHGSVHTSLLRQ